MITADEFGHEALRQADIRAQVVQRWGRQVVDEHGEVSRKKLGDIVFADERERRALEALVFPWIERRLREEMEAARSDPRYSLIVLDAAIMLETGWSRICDRLVYVDAPRDLRLRRMAEKRGWNEKEVAARESAQMSLEEKRGWADDVLDNSGSLAQLAEQVDNLLRQWGLTAVSDASQKRCNPDSPEDASAKRC